jgi:mRNA-degrading endonuclease RelE of RelBE toxin-antitoxin system
MFTFIESSTFERDVPLYLDDEEYASLQAFLVMNPESGDLIPGAGGVRRLRWRSTGGGKRGGVRVICYIRFSHNELWLLSIYSKAKYDDIPAHVLKELREKLAHDSKQ